jgi:hypothetical protein
VGATPFVDPVFGFLGTSRFAAKTPGFGDYTSLDSLARNKTYQRVTRDFRSTILRRAFAAANKPSKRRPHDSVYDKDGLFIEQAYFNF